MMLFDATSYIGKPAVLPGLSPLALLGHHAFFPRGVVGPEPDWDVTAAAIDAVAPGADVCLNIEGEGWRTDIRQYGREHVRHALHRWVCLLTFCRERRPDCSWGVYATWPIRDYWSPVRAEAEAIRAWRKANAVTRRTRDLETGRFVADDPASLCDYIYPSLYEFYDQPERWVTYAEANIAEARRYNRNVRPFIWPEYHNSNKTLGGQHLPVEHWRLILATCRNLGTDPVIWGGWDSALRKHRPWDEAAEWWLETRRFVEGR